MSTGRRESLSIFFPAYNDWGTIATMVAVAHRTARSLTDDFEVIVVNDASPDHVNDVLEELRRMYPETLRVVVHPKNRGYGGALKSGFASSTKDLIFYTDGDAQYDVRELALLWEKRDGADLVNGFKIRRFDPGHRIVVGRAYHWFTKTIFRLPIRDVDCDFRLIRRAVFDRVKLESDSGLICVELMTRVHRAGFRIQEVPVHHFYRVHGRSQFFNFSRVARVLVGMLGFWWKVFVKEPRHQAQANKATSKAGGA